VFFLIILVVLFAVMWFVLIRPQRRQRVNQAHMLATLDVGDKVVTAGGLYGEIRSVEGDDLNVEIAPNVVVRVARRAVVGNNTLDGTEGDEEEPELELGEEPEALEAKSPETKPS
jgi:preprotein translocase subunit YajC